MSDPALLAARREIELILKRHDIAGIVVLHNAPGEIEILHDFHPSYSKLIGDPPAMRLRSKLADYNGDTEAQKRDLEATLSMLRGFAETLATQGLWLMDFSEHFDKAANATHTPLHPATND